MTPQEIAERALSYGEPKEPTIVFQALREAAKRSQAKQSDTSLQAPSFQPGWMA